MNKLINKYLAQLEFYVGFELDESFDETIKSRFRDVFKYENFSQGEKMRIDLALLFTWRAVARMKNSVNTNLLILDEVFDSSLDDWYRRIHENVEHTYREIQMHSLYLIKVIYYMINLNMLLRLKNTKTFKRIARII